MDLIARWVRRLSVLSTAAVVAVLVPAAAWAAENPAVYAVADTLAKKKRSSGGGSIFGILGLLCCLVVIGAIVLTVVLIVKRRKK